MRTKMKVLFAILILGTAVLAGCRNQENTGGDAKTETIKVTDAKGEVEIPKNPERIVDLSGNSDILSVLGYQVVGTANSDAYDYIKFPSYLEETLKGAKILGYSMQDTMDVEGILELEPDLILISNVQEKMYEQLKDVAPTVMIELEQIDWREDMRKIGRMFKKEDKVDAWLKEYQKVAEEKGEEIRSQYGQETTYLPLLASGGQLYVFDAAGIGGVMFEDMGLKKPADLPKQDNISLPVISYEGLAKLDADYIFVVGTKEDTESLFDNAVFKSMRAVQEGNVVKMPSSPYFNMGYSCIGKQKFVEEFLDLMEK